MATIKSLEDLKRLREDALEKRKVKTESGNVQVIVGMGTCGIAAGARDAMKTILTRIEADGLTGITVTQTGCIGMCEKEPIVMVVAGGNPKVTYGKVTPLVAERILKEHVLGGNIVKEFVIEA